MLKDRRILPIALGVLLTGCLQSTTSMSNLAQNSTCSNTTGARVSSLKANIAQNIAVPRETATQACESARNYSCSRAVFSPDVQDGKSISQECVEAGTLGTTCIDVDSQEFDTRSAIAAAALDPTAPGTYNHSEYTCYNTALKANQSFPASALQYGSLGDALQAAHKRCGELAAALPSGE